MSSSPFQLFGPVSSGGPSNAASISKQMTKVSAISCKLEWRIDQFAKLMKLFKNGGSLVSKRFYSPKAPSVSWELHVFPNGKRQEDVNTVSFFLRQVGLQNVTEPLMTDFEISMFNVHSSRTEICRDTKDFIHQQGRGKYQVQQETIVGSLHPDGSLFLLCELEFLAFGSKDLDVNKQFECDTKGDWSAKIENSLRLANRQIFESELFADCQIEIGSKVFAAHRCILAQQSRVFRSMFSQSGMLEAQQGKIVIHDFRPETVRAMIEFIYCGSLSVFWFESCAPEILAIADKYAVLPLKEQCEYYLTTKISNENVAEMAVIADTYFAPNLKMACVDFISIHHKRVITSKGWKELKSSNGGLVNDLLEKVLNEKSGDDCIQHDESMAEGNTSIMADVSMDGSEMKKRRI